MKKQLLVTLAIVICALPNAFSQNFSINADSTEGCFPLEITFTNNSNCPTCTSYRWHFGDEAEQDVSDKQNVTYTFEKGGRKHVWIDGFNNGGHIGSSEPFEIKVLGFNKINSSNGKQICPGEEISFWAEGIWPEGENQPEMTWNLGDGTTGKFNHIRHTYTSEGLYYISLHVVDRCGERTITDSIEVTNNAVSKIKANIEGHFEVCPGDAVKFHSEYKAHTYHWDFDDGNTSTEKDPNHIYTSLGSKRIILTTYNICGNPSKDTLFVSVRNDLMINADYSYNPQPPCPNQVVTFHPHQSGQYNWNINGTSVNTRKPQYLFPDTGKFDVQLIVENGCGDIDTMQKDIQVQYNTTMKPHASIRFIKSGDWSKADSIRVCPNVEVRIKNETWDSEVEYLWDFGDGKTSEERDITHSFSSPGIYTVSMVVTTKCLGRDTAFKWVVVDSNAPPIAELGILQDTICPNDDVYFIDFASDKEDVDNSYSIWYGDGNSIINQDSFPDPNLPLFRYIYDTPGNYNYIFKVTNACGNSDTLKGVFTVDNDESKVPFNMAFNTTSEDFGDNDKVCTGDLVEFMAFGGNAYEWHFGDGVSDTGQIVYHSFPDTGIYSSYVIISHGCGNKDTVSTPTTISDSTYADPWFGLDNELNCAGDSIQFWYEQHDNSASSYKFYWDFGDSTSSTLRNPKHAYKLGGEFNVKLVVENGCGKDSSYRFVRVNTPQINFNPINPIVKPGETVNFNNSTTGAIDFIWHFGDGDTSTVSAASHVYSNVGLYSITLEATSATGCSATLTKDHIVYVHNMQIDSYISPIKCIGEDNASIQVAVSSGNAPYTYEWEKITDPGFESDKQGIFNLEPAVYTVNVTDKNGVKAQGIYTIYEPTILSAYFLKTNLTCFGDGSGKATVNATGGNSPYTYEWSNASSSQQILNLQAGMYHVTVTDSNTCEFIDSVQISAPDEMFVNAWINMMPSSCGANDAKGQASVIGGPVAPTNYQWDANAGNQTTNIASNLSAGFYKVTVTKGACSDSASVSLHDQSPPNAWPAFQEDISCYGKTDGKLAILLENKVTQTITWSTGSNDTIITNLSAGLYGASVTEAGCKRILNFEINEPAPIVLHTSSKSPSCPNGYDGMAEVIVSGGQNGWFEYKWSNSSNQAFIINRPVGNYTVTVTENFKCPTITNVNIEEPNTMELHAAITDIYFYSDDNGALDLTIVGAKQPINIQWSNSETSEDLESLKAGIYSVIISDGNGCIIKDTFEVSQPSPITIDIIAQSDTIFCDGESVDLEISGSDLIAYKWSTGEETQAITVSESGWIYGSGFSLNSVGQDSIYISVSKPYEDQEICMVTIDSLTGKNLVVWERPNEDKGIAKYNVYKETTSAGIYKIISSQDYTSMTEFVDTSSSPEQSSARYKISIIDTCGNESELSNYHKTMHLTVSTGIGVYNLIWENYEGFTFGSYTIFKGNQKDQLVPLSAIQSTLTTYTDFSSVELFYYQIAVERDEPCYSSGTRAIGGPYSQSISNLEDNGAIHVGTESSFINNNVSIFPNPYKNKAIIEFSNPENSTYTYTPFDVTGKAVKRIEDINSERFEIDRISLPDGFYMFELKGEQTFKGTIVIK